MRTAQNHKSNPTIKQLFAATTDFLETTFLKCSCLKQPSSRSSSRKRKRHWQQHLRSLLYVQFLLSVSLSPFSLFPLLSSVPRTGSKQHRAALVANWSVAMDTEGEEVWERAIWPAFIPLPCQHGVANRWPPFSSLFPTPCLPWNEGGGRELNG